MGGGASYRLEVCSADKVHKQEDVEGVLGVIWVLEGCLWVSKGNLLWCFGVIWGVLGLAIGLRYRVLKRSTNGKMRGGFVRSTRTTTMLVFLDNLGAFWVPYIDQLNFFNSPTGVKM